jgi:hypothetical protein
MKKLAIAAALFALATAAYSADFAAHVERNGSKDLNYAGVTAGTKLGSFGVEGSFDRSTSSALNVNRYTVAGSYDVLNLASATLTAKVGGAYIDPSVGVDGYAAVAGVEAALPVTKNVSLVAGYSYQKGQHRVRQFDGNEVNAGVKLAF